MEGKDTKSIVKCRPHGIMFHHFICNDHSRAQGAITAKQLKSIIGYYGDRILSAEEWYDRAVDNSLGENDICLTFDDALLCQYEIALPVLREYNLKAFWFVYSSVLAGKIEMLEVYGKFRRECFRDINQFYETFFSLIKDSPYQTEVRTSLKQYSHSRWRMCPFYSRNDTKFRFIRDVVLGSRRYNQIMEHMIEEHKINLGEFSSNLWVNTKHLRELKKEGHIIGLHSHTHPTNMGMLSTVEQEKEYRRNFELLYEYLDEPPRTMSHPCNSYNNQTLGILDGLGIKVGFRANMEKIRCSKLEFPREDHANVIKEIGG